MKRNALYIQSGGPTSVINASAYGVIKECLKHSDQIGKLYGVEHGVVGLIHEKLVDIYAMQEEEIELLPKTPSMFFGSCRYRIEKESDYESIVKVLKKYDIGYIFFNGGNGTVRASLQMKRYLERIKYPCRIIVIPKTVDNDISHIDHSPGFPSAARHVAVSISELAHDIRTYDTGLITTVEVMGRNTGFLAAATIMAEKGGNGPDLIYIPEIPFEPDKFVRDVAKVYEQKGKCFVVVAEGVKTPEGKYLFELSEDWSENDPQLNMGGTSIYLHRLLRQYFSCKIRCIDLGLMQRCAIHAVSELDVAEAIEAGKEAVQAACQGSDGVMLSIQRISSHPYKTQFTQVALEDVAETDATLPLMYLNEEKNNIRPEFLDYIEPLVGEMPNYAKVVLQKTGEKQEEQE